MLEFILFSAVLLACIALLEDERDVQEKYRPFDDVFNIIGIERCEDPDKWLEIKIIKNRFSKNKKPMFMEFDFNRFAVEPTGIDPDIAGFDMTPEDFGLIEDGFGGHFPAKCECGEPNEIVRPGKVQCSVGGHE